MLRWMEPLWCPVLASHSTTPSSNPNSNRPPPVHMPHATFHPQLWTASFLPRGTSTSHLVRRLKITSRRRQCLPTNVHQVHPMGLDIRYG